MVDKLFVIDIVFKERLVSEPMNVQFKTENSYREPAYLLLKSGIWEVLLYPHI